MLELTLKDRFDLQKYTGLLYSTVALRLQIQQFWDDIMITPDEIEQYSVVPSEDSITHSEDAPLKQIEPPTDVVVAAMKHFISEGKSIGKDDPIFMRAVEVFSSVL